MRDFADKDFLAAPLPHSHDDKRAAAHAYLRRRRISVLLPRERCRLQYVPSECGSRVLQPIRAHVAAKGGAL